jgi:hypothetical protein
MKHAKVSATMLMGLLASCATVPNTPPAPRPEPISSEEFEARRAAFPTRSYLLDQLVIDYLRSRASAEQRAALLHDIQAFQWYRQDQLHDFVEAAYPAYYDDFLAAESVNVFVSIPHEPELELQMRNELLDRLPEHVRLVGSPYDIDLMVTVGRVSESVEIVDEGLDEDSQKYGKKYRRAGTPECSKLLRAHYVKNRKELQLRYEYIVELETPVGVISSRELDGRVSQDFWFGQNLRAETPCGMEPTDIFPSDSLESRFNRRTQRLAAEDAVEEKLLRDLARDILAIDWPLRSELKGRRWR